MGDSATTPKHILVVNDDPAILELFQELLGEEGYRVTVDQFARETRELLLLIQQQQPDLVIMDFIMGQEGSGWQLLQSVRMCRETRDIPIIVCTGAIRQISELRPHLNEMRVQVVLKPFDIDHLLGIIQTVWVDPGTPRNPSVSQEIVSFDGDTNQS